MNEVSTTSSGGCEGVRDFFVALCEVLLERDPAKESRSGMLLGGRSSQNSLAKRTSTWRFIWRFGRGIAQRA
jgi:hypothetical protein